MRVLGRESALCIVSHELRTLPPDGRPRALNIPYRREFMSNSENQSRGGFLRRLFVRTEAPGDQSRNGSGEIIMPAVPTEDVTGKRLPKPKTVLFITVDDSSARRWRRELENSGYGVETVADGTEGLEILYNFAFDALLIDWKASKIEGAELMREIRNHDELKTLFVGVFAKDKDSKAEQEMAALEGGASRVFQRSSVKNEEILTALKTALFPRTLQVQPRSKQSAAAPAARGPAEAPAPAAPGVSGSSGIAMPSAPPTGRTVRIPPNIPASSLPPGVTPLNKKLLIIDADESVAAIYRAQIEAAGYEVEVALDGETGFHDLYTLNPDALLLDLLLPGGLSGSEILKKTRAQKKFEKIPILVFTNIYTRDVEEEAKAAGALRLFNKAAATPRDVIAALGEIFLPAGTVPGVNAAAADPTAAAPRPTVKFDLPPLSVPGGGAAPSAPAVPSSRSSAPAKRPATAAADTGDDTDFQAEIRESLLQGAPEFVKSLRGLLQVLLRSPGDSETQAVQLLELYTRVHSLTANAAIAGFPKVARLAGALEAMLREFQTKPEGLNASTKRTLTQAVDFLAMLFTGAATHESGLPLDEKILVVDDEIISRRVIGHSLEKAGLKSVAVSHPDEALKLLEEQSFDLVFLDVEMPGMNGFELCKRLRAMPMHAKTPVIFVTALGGFESRAKSSLSGGDDFIGKPFSYIELAVKGLIYVLKGSIGAGRATSQTRMPATVEAGPVAVSSHS